MNKEYSEEIAKRLSKELRDNGITANKRGLMIDLSYNNHDLFIDCIAGKVYLKKDNKEKYFCDLGLFKNKTHIGDAYNCSSFNTKKLIKKLKRDLDELEDNTIEAYRIKRFIRKADLNYPKSGYDWVKNKVEELRKEGINEDDLYRLAWEEYKS